METCPNELERERFLSGAVDAATATRISAHRQDCETCRAWFEEAQEDDALLDPLRRVWRETQHGERESDASLEPGPDHELPTDFNGSALERYRILRLLGSGGMGVAYEAEQQSPRRRVALKVVRPGLASESVLRRFEFEAEVLGRLDHPGIARIFEAGTFGEAGDRRPFFAMELVDGLPLGRFAEEHRLGVEARLELFVQICRAVDHAHHRGVIHRDLKPSNILVSQASGPKVLDFGVARATDADLQSATLSVQPGQIVGTLAYMSPEQVAGDSDRVDFRSDVYSLGVVLYELLAGERPHSLAGKPITEAVRHLLEERPRPLHALRPALRGDLETITSKALEKDPERRYGSAGELAADVERYLAREPISARPPSALYLLQRFSQRHRAFVIVAVAFLTTLVAGSVGSWILKEQSDANAELAQRERDNVLRLSAFVTLDELRAEADTLWPVRPALAGALRDWLVHARSLVAGLEPDPVTGAPGYYALRDAIRARSVPLQGEGEGTFAFRDDDDRWWHEQLEKLIAEIEAFADDERGLLRGTAAPHGWGVERRLAWTERIETLSTTGPEAERRWSEAIASIADPEQCQAYAGMSITPQLGLLPLGPDPDSGLWEFAHVQSGELPERNSGGHHVADEATGLVMVLIPGGEFAMGAQNDDPAAPNYDAAALDYEAPVHAVTLSAFFLSKFEATQAQWLRMAGHNPSIIYPGVSRGLTLRSSNPVENVSWIEADRTLRRFGLQIPSEAQWEYAARAGTGSPWWVGEDPRALAEAANLADAACRRESGSFSWVYEDWDDGFPTHAPVGSFRANRFGLHDVAGNLWEWCADGLSSKTYAGGPQVDPVAPRTGSLTTISRGGAWNDSAPAMRSAIRNSSRPDYRARTTGVRPARALER